MLYNNKLYTKEKLVKKINIITGHYGCGKSNLSVNLALELAKTGEKVTVIDLDIVNPYFRSADFGELFAENGITLVNSVYANTNLDIPAISFDVERIATQPGYVIIDVGGEDDGATALGRYSQAFLKFKNDIEMYYVINYYRDMIKNPNDAKQLLLDIERCARFKATAIVNNSNLGPLTTKETVIDSIDYAKEVAKLVQLPLAFTTAPLETKCDELDSLGVKYVNVYVKPNWAE